MTVREIIDRTLYEHLRVALVGAGMLPDKLLYNNKTAYQSAIDAIKNADNPVCEIFGVGHPDARVGVNGNRIIVDAKNKSKGTVGAYGAYKYEEQEDDTYTKLRYPEHTTDANYEITIVAKDVATHRLIMDLVYSTLGNTRYISTIANDATLTGEAVLVTQTGEVEIGNNDFMETKLMYRLSDIWLIPFKILATGIAKLTQIDTEYDTKLPQ